MERLEKGMQIGQGDVDEDEGPIVVVVVVVVSVAGSLESNGRNP